MNNLTCSIVLYNHKPHQLSKLVNTILQCNICKKIYLVDNSPQPLPASLGTDNRIEYIFNNKNIGYGAAHNIAIKKAMTIAKYHLIINPDILFLEGTLEKIYTYMQDNTEVGHLMPKVKYPNGDLQYTCKLIPAPLDLIVRRFLPSFLFRARASQFELRHSGYNKIMEVPYLSGCFMFLRLEALKKTGLFDERFFMYPEDIDLTRRIHKYYKTIFYPYAEIIHGHEKGSYKNAKLFFIHFTNIVKYFNKWGWLFDSERKRVNKKILAQFK